MEVKKIVEGMTAPQVAQVIDDNFKAQNEILEEDIAKQNSVIGVSEYKDFSEAEAVNVGDVRKYNGFLYECIEATTGAFDASKWKKSSFKAETEKKLSELGSEVETFVVKNNASSNLANPTEFEYGKGLINTGAVVSNDALFITGFIRVEGKDVITNSLVGSYWSICVYDINKNFIRAIGTNQYIYQEGDVYIRLTFSIGTTKPMANYGNILLPYEPYESNPIKFYLLDDERKLFNSSLVSFTLLADTILASKGNVKYEMGYHAIPEFIPINGYLKIEGASLYFIAYYDENKSFVKRTTEITYEEITSYAYCRLCFLDSKNPDGYANLKISTYSNNIPDRFIKDINGIEITDALRWVSAAGARSSYDKDSGLVAVTSAGSDVNYGESHDAIMLDIFSPNQPTNVRHRMVAYKDIPIQGGENTFYSATDTNIILLAPKKWRIMFEQGHWPDQHLGWIYVDYDYDTDTFSGPNRIKVVLNGQLMDLTQANRRTCVESFGYTDKESLWTTISSSLFKDSEGKYWGCWTGYQTNSFPIVFYSDDNMKTIHPYTLYPHNTQFEASVVKNGSKITIMARCDENGEMHYKIGVLYGSNPENFETIIVDTGSDNRPAIYNIDVNGTERTLYLLGQFVQDGAIRSGRRTRLYVMENNASDTFTSANIKYILDCPDGMVYPELFFVNNKMYVLYSSSPLGLDKAHGLGGTGKDCVMFSYVGEL